MLTSQELCPISIKEDVYKQKENLIEQMLTTVFGCSLHEISENVIRKVHSKSSINYFLNRDKFVIFEAISNMSLEKEFEESIIEDEEEEEKEYSNKKMTGFLHKNNIQVKKESIFWKEEINDVLTLDSSKTCVQNLFESEEGCEKKLIIETLKNKVFDKFMETWFSEIMLEFIESPEQEKELAHFSSESYSMLNPKQLALEFMKNEEFLTMKEIFNLN